MKKLQIVGIIVGVALIVSGVSWLAVSEPYIEFKLDGFLSYSEPLVNTIAVGFSTTPLFNALRLDCALIGVISPVEGGITSAIGGRFMGRYGDYDNYVQLGVWIDSLVGFSPFITFRVSFPLFALLSGSGGV